MHTVPASLIQHDDMILLPNSSRPHTVYGVYPSYDGQIISFEIDDHHPTMNDVYSKTITVSASDLITLVS